jgi:hypothetical protein
LSPQVQIAAIGGQAMRDLLVWLEMLEIDHARSSHLVVIVARVPLLFVVVVYPLLQA